MSDSMPRSTGPVDLQSHRTVELFSLYNRLLDELRHRRVIRSGNNLIADYVEGLVAKAFDLELAPRSSTGFDAVTPAGERYEIKARRLDAGNKSCITSAIRKIEDRQFDYFIGVVLERDFHVLRACRMPWEVALQEARSREHVNGHVINLNQALLSRHGVEDVTYELQEAQHEE